MTSTKLKITTQEKFQARPGFCDIVTEQEESHLCVSDSEHEWTASTRRSEAFRVPENQGFSGCKGTRSNLIKLSESLMVRRTKVC